MHLAVRLSTLRQVPSPVQGLEPMERHLSLFWAARLHIDAKFCRHYSFKTVRRLIFIFIYGIYRTEAVYFAVSLSVGPFIWPKLTSQL